MHHAEVLRGSGCAVRDDFSHIDIAAVGQTNAGLYAIPVREPMTIWNGIWLSRRVGKEEKRSQGWQPTRWGDEINKFAGASRNRWAQDRGTGDRRERASSSCRGHKIGWWWYWRVVGGMIEFQIKLTHGHSACTLCLSWVQTSHYRFQCHICTSSKKVGSNVSHCCHLNSVLFLCFRAL